MPDDTGQKLDIDWLKTIAGALAAVSSAVLLSTLGAAGTIIGAALGSVVATVGGALYSQGLVRSRQRLVQVPTVARRRVGPARAEGGRDRDAVADEPGTAGWRERLRTLPWRRISLVAAALFVTSLLTITAFELAAGKPVSSMTGGSDGDGRTTISRLGGGGGGGTPRRDEEAPPGGTASPSGVPSSTSGPASVTGSPTGGPGTAPSGSTTPVPTPAATPTPATTPTPGPTSPPPVEPTAPPSTG